MSFDSHNDLYRVRSRGDVTGSGFLRVVMLFGSVAVAIALIATHVLDNRYGDDTAMAEDGVGIDRTVTGTIGYEGIYTIRKSVLQTSPNSICILRDNGTRSGDC